MVIGNGIAGNSAISAIRKKNKKVDITLISDESTPLYSPCIFHKYLAGEKRRQELFLKNLEEYKKENVHVILEQKVTEIDNKDKKIFVGNRSIRFDKLILALGSKPIRPPIKGIDKRGVFTLKTINDADNIRSFPANRAVIIGSGPIGLETAIALRKKGVEIYIVEIFDRILPRLFDDKPASLIRECIEKHGIHVLTGEKVLEIVGTDAVDYVVTDKRRIKCDMVILAAGVRPNVELARKVGLNIGDLGGISINEYMEVSEDIYACGDCVESRDIVTGQNTLSLLWHNAKRQGKVAGYNSIGESRRYIGSIDAASIEIFGTYAMSMGLTESSLRDKRNFDIIEKTYSSNYYKLIISNDKLVGVQLLNKTENLGLLFSLIMRKDNLSYLREIITNWNLLSLYPWRYRLSRILKL